MTLQKRPETVWIDVLAEDVAAASAACLVGSLNEILSLAPPELFTRLRDHIHTALLAYADGRTDWTGRPARTRAGGMCRDG